MPASAQKRIVLNRSKVDAVVLVIADGMHEVGVAIIDAAAPNAPDSPLPPYPIGEGLPKQGGVLTYVGEKKVASYGLDGKEPKKPRAVKTKGRLGIVVVAGWGFPGRLNEIGSVHNVSRPFLSPAADEVTPKTEGILRKHVAPALARMS